MESTDHLSSLERLDQVRYAIERLERQQRHSLAMCKAYLDTRAALIADILSHLGDDPYHVLTQQWIDEFTAKMDGPPNDGTEGR